MIEFIHLFLYIFKQERKKLKALFPTNPFNDEEECRYNLKSYQEYIMTGNMPSRSADLYPLPHRAYQGQVKKDTLKKSQIQKVVTRISKSPQRHSAKRQHAIGKLVDNMNASILALNKSFFFL